MQKTKFNTRYLAVSGVIAALYAALTFVVFPIAYSPVQLRISEALTVLPLLFPEAVPGLFIGCLIANIPMGIYDMLIGSVTTLAAALLTRYSKKIYLGVIPPIVLNALIVPLIFIIGGSDEAYYINVLTVGAGQALAVLALGLPLYFASKRYLNPLYERISANGLGSLKKAKNTEAGELQKSAPCPNCGADMPSDGVCPFCGKQRAD